jgi:hypothetical protein
MSRIRADRYTNREGTGAPTFADGVNVVGISSLGITTVTGVGQTALTVNGDARITGVLTVGQGSVTIGSTNITTQYINDIQYPTAGPLSNRNLVINGAMNVAQRGTAAETVDTDGKYRIDRFKTYASASNTHVVAQSQDSDVPTGQGFTNSYKLEVTTAAATPSAGYVFLAQSIEGYNSNVLSYGNANCKTVTISFWVKCSVVGTYGIVLRNSLLNYNYTGEYSISASGVWEYKTITIPGADAGSWQTTNETGVEVLFGIDVGSDFEGITNTWQNSNKLSTPGMTNTWSDTVNNVFLLTGLQLEIGSRATPFEHRSFHDEQLKCMRYYQHFGNALASDDGTDDGFMMFHNWATTTAYGAQKFIVPMRARPSLTSPSSGLTYYSGGSLDSSINLDLIGANTNNGELRINDVSGLTQGTSGWLRIEGSGAYIAFSAEL